MKKTTSCYKERMATFRQAAKEAGVKLTPQRVEIYRQVLASDNHPSADEIHTRIQRKLPMISLDTVYRTLWLLADLGLINTVNPREESIRFDAKLEEHHHFRCETGGKIIDFESAELTQLPLPPVLADFGQTLSVQIEVRGICIACQKTPSSKV